jgi:hypothetical protein
MPIATLPPGVRLAGGRYQIVGTLGEGGFAITYEAIDSQGHAPRTVVIKEHAYAEACARDPATHLVVPLKGQDELHRKLIARFLREAAILKEIAHAHLVPVEEAWEDFGTAYYSMARLEGATLADDVARAAELPWSDARRAAIEQSALQLLAALGAAHQEHVFHCDVKPENMVITPRGLVLIDFGAARPEASLGRTVTLLPFTAGYAAPELQSAHTIKDVGPWTDLYGWAMVVLGLTLGHGPMGGPMDASARLGLKLKKADDPYTGAEAKLVERGLSPAWASAIIACLELDHEQRPRSVADLVERLGANLADAIARPPPPGGLLASERLGEQGRLGEREELGKGGTGGGVSGGARTIAAAPLALDAIPAEAPDAAPPPTLRDQPPAAPPLVPPVAKAHRASPRGGLSPALIGGVGAGVAALAGIVLLVRSLASSGPATPQGANTSSAPSAVVTADAPDQAALPSYTPEPGKSCASHEVLCSGSCKQKVDPIWGCGSCKRCRLDNTATSRCEHQACAPDKCVAGWANCDGNPANGCETHTAVDPAHCGACGTACARGAHATGVTCESGACKVTTCEGSFLDCNRDPRDGCEVDRTRDASNCGACGAACARGPHVTAAACEASACKVAACEGSFLDCDRDPRNGCEVDRTRDTSNCGACGTACARGPFVAAATCEAGACKARCEAGHLNCDGNAQNGCEVDGASDANNCGACGRSCRKAHVATAACAAGACQIVACEAGFLDLDRNPENGCEARPPPLPPPVVMPHQPQPQPVPPHQPQMVVPAPLGP